MFGLMNIILASPLKTSTLQVHYSFDNILKVIFIIQTYSILFHVNLILHPLHLDMKQLSHMTLSYLPQERKIGFNLLDDEDFTIPYITDTIPNSPDGHRLPPQAKQNVSIIAINGEDPITAQGVLDELNCHQTPRGKSNIKISL